LSASCQSRPSALQQTVSYFDHLVGARQQLIRHIQAERLRGLKVDDQLDLGALLHWQVRGLRALEDAAGIDAGLAIGIGDVDSVAGFRQVAHSKSTR
jgi:hypothetical protein